MTTGAFRHLARLCALGLAGGAALPAQADDNVDTSSTAEVLPDTTLVVTHNLDFGTLVPSTTGGAIQINAATNAVTTTGNLIRVGPIGHRATFTANAAVGVIMIYSGDSTVTLTRSGGTETMTANLTWAAGDGLIVATVFGLPIGVKATAAEQEIHAGGTMFIPGNQAAGAYEGEFSLTVTYL